MTETTTPPAQPWRNLAAIALANARDGHLVDAGMSVRAISDRYGSGVLGDVILSWIDTVIEHCGLTADWIDVVTDPDTPELMQWPGRLFAARLADIRERFEALLQERAGEDTLSTVVPVLTLCGAILADPPRDVR